MAPSHHDNAGCNYDSNLTPMQHCEIAAECFYRKHLHHYCNKSIIVAIKLTQVDIDGQQLSPMYC